MTGPTVNQRVINLDLTKTWNFIGFSGSLVTAAVWALWIRLYLKTVLLLSSVGECKLRTKFCTTWPLCTFWCKLLDRQNSTTSDCNSQFLRKLHSLVCTYTVGLFLCHCLIFTAFLLPVVFIMNIIIIVITVRQPFPHNSDPSIYVQQNTLGLFVTGPLN